MTDSGPDLAGDIFTNVRINDTHCHFFSSRFFERLATEKPDLPEGDPVAGLTGLLGWDPPGTPGALADRWIQELDRQGVTRAVLIASVPGDEESVADAVARHPSRLAGFFMLDPTRNDAVARAEHALDDLRLRGVCLFPAMHHYRLEDERVAAVFTEAARRPGVIVFVHCGVLSVGVRRKLGLPSRFDVTLGNPLGVAVLGARFPSVPIIIPHFGAGFFREALMAADLCANLYLDTSSSNAWTKYHPGLSLPDVFRYALAVAGPDRLLFGTDSSFFPRGWQRPVLEAQQAALAETGADDAVREKVFGGNFDRLL